MIKIFRVYNESIEANIALTKLQANDVPCFLTNEQMNNLLWHMTFAMGGIRLMVQEEDFEKANRILSIDPIQITNESNGEIVCPNCRSNNINYGSLKSKPSLFGLILSLLFFLPAPITKKGYHCFNCELDFEKEEK